MIDVVAPEVRSRMMSSIKNRNTVPERLVRSGLWASGFRFRLHRKDLPGRPDLVLPRWRTAIFVNGCFWHAHTACQYFRIPNSRMEFWRQKLETNRARDASAIGRLIDDNWKVITIWECGLRADSEQVVSLATDLIRRAPSMSAWDIRQDPNDKAKSIAVKYSSAIPT